MNPNPSRRTLLAALAATAVVAAGAATVLLRQPAHAREAPPRSSAISVRSVVAQAGDVPLVLSSPGTVTPQDSVDVRAQASATVAQVHVKDGQFVKAGELLFTLDARAAEASTLAARAQLARDTATLADAQRQLQRNRDLLAQNFVSQAVVDSSLAQVSAQQAVLQADQAQIAASSVNLSFTRITAPMAGRLGAIGVVPGSLVQPSSTAPMVTITKLDPIEVAFALPQRNLPDALAALQSGSATVTLPKLQAQGRLSFVDSLVDPATGTIKVKARFDNKDQKLWPGAYVDVSFAAQMLHDAVTVPQAALIRGDDGASLYTIDADNKARKVSVQASAAVGDSVVVQGVQAGQRVIVDGKQDVRPGAAVADRSARQS